MAVYNKGQIKPIGTVAELRQLVPSQTIISITLDKLSPEIVKGVEALKNVKAVSQKDEKTLIVYAEDSKEALNTLLVWVEGKGLHLESINLSATTLDDIFIHLTTNDTKND